TCFREAIRLDPKLAHAHNNLGIVLTERGDLAGAEACFREAIRLDPKLAHAHYNLGLVLSDRRDLAGAKACFREAIRLDPTPAGPHSSLAGLVAAGRDGLRDGKQAVEHAPRACELTGWKEPACIATLAAAHAEAGDFDKAVAFQKQALAFPAFE